MRIALLDLMPLLWGMCAAAALLLALQRDWGAPTRTLPAVCTAVAFYFFDFPPRVQVIAFLGIYLCDALCYWILCRIAAIRRTREAKPEAMPTSL